MINPIKAFKVASRQTKIFWLVTLSVGILTTALCLYPYVWFTFHRSGKENIIDD